MKAYVFVKKGEIELREIPDVQLCAEMPADRRAAILRPRFVSPCSSDVHTVYAGPGPRRDGLVLGHEGLAEIVSVGSEVRDFRPGELVAVSAVMPDVPDGNGHENSLFSGSKLGRNINGMWSEQFYVPDADQNLAHIPDGVTPEQALMAVDVMATGWTAAEQAEIASGQTVVVLGLGAIGLAALAAAKELGAGLLIAVGSPKRPECTQLAAEYGADLVISYRDGSRLFERSGGTAGDSETFGQEELLADKMEANSQSFGKKAGLFAGAAKRNGAAERHPAANSTKSAAVDAILNLTENQGADRVIICGGGQEALAQACDLVKYGTGIVSNVAYFEGTGTIGLPIFSLGRGMAGKTFKFSFCRGGRHRMEKLLQLIAEGNRARKAAQSAAASGTISDISEEEEKTGAAGGLKLNIPDFGKLVTHHLSGSREIPHALRQMRDKPEGLIKIMVEVNGWGEG